MTGSAPSPVLASRLTGSRHSHRSCHSHRSRLRCSLGFGLGLSLVAGAVALTGPARAQQAGYGQTLGAGQEQRVLDYGSGPSKGSSILDSANPIELMNKLRRGTAMDEATPPQDAIDAALREFHSQSQPVAN